MIHRRYTFTFGLVFTLFCSSAIAANEGCHRALENEWVKMAGREDSEGNARRPTIAEQNQLRNVISNCNSITAQFDLTDSTGLVDEVWGQGTVMQLAVELDDVSVLDQLVAEGHSLDESPGLYYMPTLFLAIYRESKGAFFWLLSSGVDPNLTNQNDVTPLMVAASHSQSRLPSIIALIEEGAQLDVLDAEGRTALVYAARSGNEENARALVSSGANPTKAREYLSIELSEAEHEDHVNAVRKAIEILDKLTGDQ